MPVDVNSTDVESVVFELITHVAVYWFHEPELRVDAQQDHCEKEDEKPEVGHRKNEKGFGKNVEAQLHTRQLKSRVINRVLCANAEMRQVDEDGEGAEKSADNQTDGHHHNTAPKIFSSGFGSWEVDHCSDSDCQLVEDLRGGIDPDCVIG